MLLWAIESSNRLTKVQPQPRRPIEDWYLADYISVSSTLSLIKADAAQVALLAKDYRNLVHPGRAKRLGQTCDRAAALTALTAMELLIRDLS
jgi:hypothetical protein